MMVDFIYFMIFCFLFLASLVGFIEEIRDSDYILAFISFIMILITLGMLIAPLVLEVPLDTKDPQASETPECK